jgi:hypothetical protein
VSTQSKLTDCEGCDESELSNRILTECLLFKYYKNVVVDSITTKRFRGATVPMGLWLPFPRKPSQAGMIAAYTHKRSQGIEDTYIYPTKDESISGRLKVELSRLVVLVAKPSSGECSAQNVAGEGVFSIREASHSLQTSHTLWDCQMSRRHTIRAFELMSMECQMTVCVRTHQVSPKSQSPVGNHDTDPVLATHRSKCPRYFFFRSLAFRSTSRTSD